VRVIRVDLDGPGPDPNHVLPRAERLVSEPTRRARAAARVLLGEVIGVDPRAVPIARRCLRCGDPNHGRPFLDGYEQVSFSVSHSAEVALVAICTSGPTIGIDLEAHRPRTRLPQLAERVLASEHYAHWQRLGPDEQLDAFLRAWTMKEAYLKATGVGITTRLTDVPLSPAGWHVDTIDAPPGFVAALASDQPVDVTYEAFQYE
jgi:4'-phosphopantetheinyl transferase